MLSINGDEWPEKFSVDTWIPESPNRPEGGEVMLGFRRVHGGDYEDVYWGNAFGLPHCALIHERLPGLRWLADALARAGVEVSGDCTLVCGDEDNEWEDFGGMVLEKFARLPETYRRDAAEMFYASPGRQAWIRGEAG